MFVIYEFLFPIIALLLVPVISIALIVTPKFRAGFMRKLGFYNKNFEGENTTVFHAVSVGETNAIINTVKAYREKYPERKIIITNTTQTGHDIAKKVFKDIADEITFFPFDFANETALLIQFRISEEFSALFGYEAIPKLAVAEIISLPI